jgi:hypothetical protein
MNLDNALWIAGIGIEATVFALLLYRRAWKAFPVFSVYIAWDIFSNVGAYAILRFLPTSYLTAYLIGTIVDSALEFGILVELAWSVLRPFRDFLPRSALTVGGGLIVAIGVTVWHFATIPGFGNLPPEWHLLMRLQQTASILRVLLFLAMAGCSQLLSIGWRNRELQIAAGLGFYSLVSLAVAAVNMHTSAKSQYNHLIQVVVVSYLCSLLYWAFSFAQQEAERREFTPRMQGFLLAVAGVAKANRVALTTSVPDKLQDHREP